MKKKKVILTSLSLIAIFAFTLSFAKFNFNRFFMFSPQYIIDERANIVGSWVSEEDANYKLIFESGGIGYVYYGNDLNETFTYSISNETPQCGISVYVNESEETSFLKLENTATGFNDCYEINGISDVLSISHVGSGSLSIFNKQ